MCITIFTWDSTVLVSVCFNSKVSKVTAWIDKSVKEVNYKDCAPSMLILCLYNNLKVPEIFDHGNCFLCMVSKYFL